MVDLGPVSFLKASLSYAQVGNDAPAYSTGNAFSVTLDPNINSQRAAAFPFGGFTGARAANTVGNSTLKPEKTSGYELGIEVGALNERINFALSYYNQLS